ncbi:MAG: right-handed parallel beta-helix repeat-containing protein [bacterium]|nr:right-handed parallel beta-helix repeat-containing protein [bacterium]
MRAILMSVLVCCASGYAEIFIVGPGSINSVSTAVERASSGDEVIVYPGTYYGPVYFRNKNINVHSLMPDTAAGVAAVVLRCGSAFDDVVVFGGGEGPECQLNGFTLTGSNAWYGIYGAGTYATLANNVIYNFTGWAEYPTFFTYGIYWVRGAIISNTVRNCRNALVECYGEIQNCRVYDNSRSGLYFCDASVRNTVIYGNGLAGVSNSYCTIENCTIRNNAGGGIAGAIAGIKNSIVAFNGAWGAAQMPDIGVLPEYSCTDDPRFDTAAYLALGTLCTNPLFVGASAGAYQLSVQSPCINAGQNQDWMTNAVDLDGHARILYETVDMGAFEYADTLPVPAAPDGVTASKGKPADAIVVNWNALGDANLYAVYRGTNADPAQAGQLTSDCAVPCFTSTLALAQSTRYYYWVNAHNRYGWGAMGGGDYGYVGLPPLPDAPASISASDGTYTNKIIITWSTARDAQWYALYRLAAPTNGAPVALLQTPSNAYVDLDVALGTRYYYWVRAGNTSGWSAFSAPDSGYVLPMQPVAATWVFKPGKASDKLKGNELTPLLGPYFSNGYNLVIKDAATLQTICGPFTMTSNKNKTVWKYKLKNSATVNYTEKYNKKKALYKTQLLLTTWVHMPATYIVALVPAQLPTAAAPAVEILLVPTGRRTRAGGQIMQEYFR